MFAGAKPRKSRVLACSGFELPKLTEGAQGQVRAKTGETRRVPLPDTRSYKPWELEVGL